MNLVAHSAPVFERTVEAEFLDRFYGPVKGHPRHRARVRKRLALATHFPNPLARLGPYAFKMFKQRALKRRVVAALSAD
jgi:hypothetical protein